MIRRGCIQVRRVGGRETFRVVVSVRRRRICGPSRSTRAEAEADRAELAKPDGVARLLAIKEHGQQARADLEERAQRTRRQPIPCVYFVQSIIGGPIKIGVTADVSERLRAYRTHHPYPLRVLATYRAKPDAERELHERFGHLRAEGEWFEAAPELLAFVAEIAIREGHTRRAGGLPELIGVLRALASQLEAAVPSARDVSGVIG